MCRLGWLLSLVFATATFALVYMFVIRGEVVPSSDGRSAIVLSAGERDLVLAEMRDFLVAVQAITAAAAEGDAAAVASASRRVGAAAQEGVPPSLMGKLPLSFKQLGFSTHAAFDQLAMDTEALGDTRAVPTALGQLMNNCTGCHAAYRLTTEEP